MSLIRSRRDVISRVVEAYSASVSASLWWEPAGGQGGFTLPSDLLVELASYVSRLDFYFASSSDASAPGE
jgi:hypothetical protein